MREGKDLILATKEFANDFKARSWWCVLSTGGLLIIALAGTLILPLILKPFFSILAALLLLRFFVIYHDHQHNAILPDSKLADVLMTLFGIYALSPSRVWKSSHNYHHNHNSKLRTANIGSFPIMTKEQYFNCSKFDRFKYYVFRHPLLIFFGYIFVFVLGMCVFPFLNNPKKHYDSLLAIIVHISVAILLFYLGGWSAMMFTHIMPIFIASGIGSYLFYAQHNFPEVIHIHNAGWTYHGAALQSSSFIKMPRVMHWFTANIGYHHIHHLNSRIPFYRLPEVMKKIPELQVPKTTSLNPMDIFRCLQLHVWDSNSSRMIRYNEL